MAEPKLTIRDVFTIARGDAQGAEGAGDPAQETGVSVKLEAGGLAPSAIRDTVLGQMDSLLDVEVSSIIGAAWSKARALQQYADKSKFQAGEAILVALADHAITSTHRPAIEMLVNGKRVDSLAIGISLQLAMKGLVLKIENGRITEIRPGECTVSGRIAFREWVIAEEKSRPFKMPGVLPLGEGIEIASAPETSETKPSPDEGGAQPPQR